MNFCMQCGAALGPGRFCTNCGTPIGAVAPTAVPVDAPADAPIWAPEVEPTRPLPRPTRPARHARPVPPPKPARKPDGPGVGVWVLLAIGVLIAMILGSCLATAGDDSPAPAASSTTTGASPTGSSTPDGVTPSASGKAGANLARYAKVRAPKPIRPGTDLDGNRVPYPAKNMLDSRPETAYRLAGSARGTLIRFEFGKAHTISAVGLINGYAKVDGGVNWYPRNRRIEQVEWRFDDGTTVVQNLTDTAELQTTQIEAETTKTVELLIVVVSEPGKGSTGKDTTAISDVLLLGG